MNSQSEQTIIIPGKDLSKEDLAIINAARIREFNSPKAIEPAPDNENWDKKFFLVKKEGRLMAFGRLHDVDVTFKNEIYHVLGIASVVALEKGKGYGKTLMACMKDYLEQSGQTALGFCKVKNSPFYIKCGFNIIPDGQKLFHYSGTSLYQGYDALYLSGKDMLIEKMMQHPGEVAELSRAHW